MSLSLKFFPIFCVIKIVVTVVVGISKDHFVYGMGPHYHNPSGFFQSKKTIIAKAVNKIFTTVKFCAPITELSPPAQNPINSLLFKTPTVLIPTIFNEFLEVMTIDRPGQAQHLEQ